MNSSPQQQGADVFDNTGLPPELQHQQRIMREMESSSAKAPADRDTEAASVEPQADQVQQPVAQASQPEPVQETVPTVHPQPSSYAGPTADRSYKDIDQARNFRAVKEAAERAARERDEALARLRQYENPSSYAKAPADMTHEHDEEEVEELNVKPDDLVEGKHLLKYNKEIKALKQQLKQFANQTHASTAEARLRIQYQDFDKVMTLENIRALSAAYPELAKSINATNDLYDKSVSAYTLIKRFGIYDETPPYEAEKQKAVANAAKPRPLASVSPQQGDTPMQRANIFAQGLTDELKQKLREEMAQAAKRY